MELLLPQLDSLSPKMISRAIDDMRSCLPKVDWNFTSIDKAGKGGREALKPIPTILVLKIQSRTPIAPIF